MNKGPEVFVNDKSLSASILVHSFCSRKSATTFEPTGYPELKPSAKAKAP